MRRLLADLHVHTVLSPCAEVEMIPPLIVRQALALGLGLIAITDHNAAANCAAVMRAAAGSGLIVLPGIEAETSEEVHVVCLFDTIEQVLTWQGILFDHLPPLNTDEDAFGAQYVVDHTGKYLQTERRLLAAPTDLPLARMVERVRGLGGLAIPAHVDRPAFSLLSNLGFVPAGLDAPALELFRRTDPATARSCWPDLSAWPLFRSGDAHRLSELSATLCLTVDGTTVAEIERAFRGQAGRGFSVMPFGAGQEPL